MNDEQPRDPQPSPGDPANEPHSPPPQPPPGRPGGPAQTAGPAAPKWLWWVIGGLAIVIVLLLVFWLSDDDEDSPTTTTIGEAAPTTTVAEETTTTAVPEETTTTTIVDETTTTTSEAPPPADPVALSFVFEEDAEDWVAGFADLPEDAADEFELESSWEQLPGDLEGFGLYLAGTNRSDDLFMYWTREISGLAPDTTYRVEFVLELATNVPSGLAGIGGSPTDAVFVKAGASAEEPTTEPDELGFLRLQIDVGRQFESGANATVIGTLDNPDVEDDGSGSIPFALLTVDGTAEATEFEGLDDPVVVTTSSNGSLWLITGIDSGFEGRTEVYYSGMEILLTPVGG